jgi:hypothetical protein
MVSSSAITIAVDVECLLRDGFSPSETIRFGSLEFIIDCFDGLNLSLPEGRFGCRRHRLNLLWATILAMAHDSGLHQGAPHDF